jgi:hypothetical protein
MKKLVVSILALVLVIGFISCAGTGGRGLTSYGEERVYEVGYEKLCRSTAEYLANRGYPILQTDFEAGIIKTDYRLGVGWAPPGVRGEKRARVDAKLFKVDETATRLVLEIFSEVKDDDVYTTWQLVDGNTRDSRVFYKRYFEAISMNAQAKIRQ